MLKLFFPHARLLKMRVLFSCGNAPGLPTGYGGQGLLALQALQAMGATVHVLAWNLSQPAFQPFQAYSTEEVLRINPTMRTAMEAAGAETVQWGSVRWYCNPYTAFPTPIRKQDLNRMIVESEADLFLALQDIFMFEPGPFFCLSAVWMPLHFLPVEHPTVLSLSDFDMQLPISGWGAFLLQPLQARSKHKTPCLRHIEVLPHGRNVNVFKPSLHDDEAKALRKLTRQKWNWPQDAFVVFLVASNSEESGRKALDAQLQAYEEFASTHPNAWLHIHSEIARAYDIGRLLETFGRFSTRSHWVDFSDHRARTSKETVLIGDRVSVSHASQLLNVKENELVNLYHASDVLLAATCSEGCGVPILEAQLCGTPVVTTAATAMWEETMFGISVRPLQWIARMDFNSGWYLPDKRGIAKALQEISSWSEEHKQANFEKVYAKLVKSYSNEAVIQTFQDIFSCIDDWTFESKNSKLLVDEERHMYLRAARQSRLLWQKLMKTEAELQKQVQDVRQRVKDALVVDYIVNR